MALDLTSLKDAVSLFQEALRYTNGIKDKNSSHFRVLRAGVIQNFEFTFELCWKYMKRWISNNPNIKSLDIVTTKDIFRMSSIYKLIDNPTDWFKFHDARNISSHTYNEGKAERVYNVAVEFLPSAETFLENLERAND